MTGCGLQVRGARHRGWVGGAAPRTRVGTTTRTRVGLPDDDEDEDGRCARPARRRRRDRPQPPRGRGIGARRADYSSRHQSTGAGESARAGLGVEDGRFTDLQRRRCPAPCGAGHPPGTVRLRRRRRRRRGHDGGERTGVSRSDVPPPHGRRHGRPGHLDDPAGHSPVPARSPRSLWLGALHAPRGRARVARAAAAMGTVPVLSTVAGSSPEEFAASATGPKWFQLYSPEGPEQSEELVGRAQRAGYEGLVITLDTPALGHRERDVRHGVTQPFRFTASSASRLVAQFALRPRWLTGMVRAAVRARAASPPIRPARRRRPRRHRRHGSSPWGRRRSRGTTSPPSGGSGPGPWP